jgi:PAS domain S-box-containing protein
METNADPYRLVASIIPDAILVFAFDGARIEDVNDSALALYGYSREEMIGLPLSALTAEPEVSAASVASLARGKTVFVRNRLHKRKDGTTFSVEIHAALLSIGRRAVGVSVIRDISAALRVRMDLVESESRFRQFAENIDQILWMTDEPKSRMEYISPAYERIWGRSCESLYAEPASWLEAILPEDRERVLAALERQKNGLYDVEFRIRRPDGEVRWISDRAFPVKDAEGRIIRMAGVAQDVTEQRLTEERLRDSEAILVKAQEIANIGSWVYDIVIEKVHWSKECCRMLGVAEVSWRPKAEFFELVHPDDRVSLRKILTDALASGAVYVAEFRAVRPDGAVRWMRARADIIRDKNGRAVKMVGINNDITDQKLDAEKLQSSERQLRESQKLEAIGRLAGGIAHDFNNILTAILGLTEMSIKALPETDPVRKDLEEVRLSSLRAAKLTHQLLAFSRRQVIVPKVLRFDDAILGVSKMLHRIIGEEIKIDIRPGAAGVFVRADSGHLEQLIVNLAVNARDAMPEGGTLTIETSAARLDIETVSCGGALKPGDYAVVRVTDTGTGMDEVARARMFEPFFTTKEPGKGTGLGLSTCYGIVKQHGGAIFCDSPTGHSASFRILLPRCEPEGAVCKLPIRPKEVKGSGRVLVVEDEEAVRRLVVRMLGACGYETVAARDGQEGLEVLGRDAERRIRLVVADMVMPRLGGRKMADAVAASRPDVRMLFTSGYTDDLSGAEAMGSGVEFLAKPFSAQELAESVRRALDVG